jgi:hypothetical protein
MASRLSAIELVADEARALLSRVDRVKPFALTETMVVAAAPSLVAQAAVDAHIVQGREALRGMITGFLQWLRGPAAGRASVAEVQRRLAFLRLRFNALLSQLDIFADVMTQRSENETGVWLGGLDVVAADMLNIPGRYFLAPPLLCYLDRGHGAAIRRARTRLPGGGANPAAVIRVPRERMIVGAGMGSSLCHEVGHQAAALLDLVSSLKPELARMRRQNGGGGRAWELFDRWISEILADFWSVARVGVGATLGLLAVVSLPRVFVFRVTLDDPHPMPWIRVKLSCAMGNALYPDPQWRRIAEIWEEFYPLAGLDLLRRRLIADLEATLPAFVELLVNHRPQALRGAGLGRAVLDGQRAPGALRARFDSVRQAPEALRDVPPSLAFAVISQARADGKLSPEAEGDLLGKLLTHWAVFSALDASTLFAAQSQRKALALASP